MPGIGLTHLILGEPYQMSVVIVPICPERQRDLSTSQSERTSQSQTPGFLTPTSTLMDTDTLTVHATFGKTFMHFGAFKSLSYVSLQRGLLRVFVEE